MGQERKLVAAEVLRQVLAHYNFGDLAILVDPYDPDRCSPDRDRIVFFEDNKIVASVYDTEDPNVVDVEIPDAYRMIRPQRYSDFHPCEHGLEFEDPYISISWVVDGIRESVKAMAEMPPPNKPRIRPREVKVKGGLDDK